MNILKLIQRKEELFKDDILTFNNELTKIIESSSFLVLGAAGSIGNAVSKEIFSRNPKKLHLIDISENNLVEIVSILYTFLSSALFIISSSLPLNCGKFK